MRRTTPGARPFRTLKRLASKQKAARLPERLNGVPMTLQPIADLVARTDLNELVQRYTSPPRTSGNVSTYHCPNPAHPDQHPSFSVTTNRNGRQVARCFSQCSWHGDALEFIKWIEGVSTSEAKEKLCQFLGLPGRSFERRDFTPNKPSRPISPKAQDTTKRATGEQAEQFLASYLRSRGWPPTVARSFGLEVVVDYKSELRVRHTYLMPHEDGSWVPGYWQDRGSKRAEPKWLSARGSKPILFNLPSLEVQNLEAVVICEGAADTITASVALEGCSFVACVGVPGTSAWQPSWASLFTGLRVVVAADNDAAGRTLEEAIRQSLDTAPQYFRPSLNDLTDTAKEIGLPALREAFLGLLGVQPEAPERSLEQSIELLRRHFPLGTLEEGAA